MVKNTTIKKDLAVFAGIDYHKKSFTVTLGDADGNVVLQEEHPSDVSSVLKFFRSRPSLICAVENCRGVEWFVDTLKECGCEVKVANTHGVRLIAESRCKNDKIDSRILMELVSRNYLPVCYQPTEQERLLREKLKFRTKLMRSRTRYKNVARALMDKENKGKQIKYKTTRKKESEAAGLHPERQERLNKSVEIIDFFDTAVGIEDKELARLAADNPDVKRLRTIPGVGVLSALFILAEIGDISRFKNAKNVASYFGLVPRLYASSNVRRLGSITKHGSSLMRRILVQDSWVAIRCSPTIRMKYNRILKRRGKRIAIVAIARMIAEISFRILRDKTVYNEELLTLG